MARRPTINDDDREEFVNNDEGLYDLWQRSGKGITVWVRKNRPLIDEVIRNVRDNVRPPDYLKYGGTR